MKARTTNIIGVTVTVFVLVGSITAQAIGWKNCHDDGGQYVRGTIWMTCVDKNP